MAKAEAVPPRSRIPIVVMATLLPLAAVGPVAWAQAPHGDTYLVADTVYDGAYAVTQNTWSTVQVQFAVTPGDRVVNIAPAVAFCAPTESFPLAGADVRGDTFSSYTSPFPHYSVTMIGTLERDGKAKGTGALHAETIQGQPCTEEAHWTADALPKGTGLCFSVDPGLPVHTTVTNMTCGEAYRAWNEGSASSAATGFSASGWDCSSDPHDPVVRTICTQGDKTFRLP
jgi:hypothetical protein